MKSWASAARAASSIARSPAPGRPQAMLARTVSCKTDEGLLGQERHVLAQPGQGEVAQGERSTRSPMEAESSLMNLSVSS